MVVQTLCMQLIHDVQDSLSFLDPIAHYQQAMLKLKCDIWFPLEMLPKILKYVNTSILVSFNNLHLR